MANRDLVVVGASAGGVEVLQHLLRALPRSLDAAIMIVLHTSRGADGFLAQVMQRASQLPSSHPEDRTRIEKGKVYVARPDFHMIVEGGLIRVLKGPRENHHRPAIDPLFRSAAAFYGQRVIGVILTGALDDGSAGLMTVRARGGAAIVQDPSEALFASMPESALEQVPDAQVLPVAEISEAIVALTKEGIPEERAAAVSADSGLAKETKITELDMSEIENEDRPGRPSAFACPDCGGVLWEIDDHGFLRFRCRVGHAFTARHLGAEQHQAVETALWSALRALEERASLYRRMAERATRSFHGMTAQRYEERAENSNANARVLRDFLVQVAEEDGERVNQEQGS